MAWGAFAGIAASARFVAWRDPDELRTGLTSGRMQVVIVPANTAANLFNRGLGLRMVNAMTLGLNYIVVRDPAIATPADLADRSIALPFRNDTPDILLRRVLAGAGVAEGDVTVVPAATPIEAVQLLLTGRAEAALLPEPATTMAEMTALQAGIAVTRAIDIQAEWGRLTGVGRRVPQAGLALIWFGSSDGMVIVTILVGVVPLVFAGTAEGVAARDRGLDAMARAFGAGPVRRFLAVGLRQMLTHLFPALVLGLATAVKVAVMIEVLASVGGIGNELARARQYMDVTQALAWIGIAVAGLIAVEYCLVHPVRAEFERWREAARPWGLKR